MKEIELKNNSITLFRYIAAFQVVLGHAAALLKITFPEWITQLLGLFQGVPLFFGLSGFLIWQSLERNDSFKTYVKKRIVRIYPQLWMGVMLSMLTIMIFYKEKINWLMLLLFIFTQSTFLQFWTPEFLRNYGSGTPNGSLWTICIFVQFYLAAYFLHKILKNKQPAVWLLTIGGFLLSDIMYPAWGGVIKNEILYKLCGQTLLPYLYLFLTGSFLSCFYRQMIPVLKKTWWIFLAGDMFFTMSGYDLPGRYSPFRTICLILAVIGIAYRINIKINYDISYEIYIFHGIILNLLLELGLCVNMLYFFITIAACILLSAGAYELKKRLVRG